MIKSRIPERLLDRVEKRMKALLIINGLNISDEEIKSFNRREISGFERISLNSFIFNLSESSNLLADIQNYLQSRGNKYSILYFEKDPTIFTYLK